LPLFLQGWESRYLTASTRSGVRLDMALSFCAVLIHAHSMLESLRYQLWHELRWVWKCEISMRWFDVGEDGHGLRILNRTDLHFLLLSHCISNSNLEGHRWSIRPSSYHRLTNLNPARGIWMNVNFWTFEDRCSVFFLPGGTSRIDRLQVVITVRCDKSNDRDSSLIDHDSHSSFLFLILLYSLIQRRGHTLITSPPQPPKSTSPGFVRNDASTPVRGALT
jgi:hypothetical protein